MLSFFLNFTGGLSTGKSQIEDCCLVSGLYWYTKVSVPVTVSQTRSDLPQSNFRIIRRCQSPFPSSAPRSIGGHPTDATLPYIKVMTEDPIPASRWKIRTVFYLTFCNSWVFFDQTLPLDHVLFGSNGHRLTTPVTVFERRFAKLKFPCTTCDLKITMENGPQSILTIFGSIAGKTSPLR